MSDFGVRADIKAHVPECPLIATSGHSGDALSPCSTEVWIDMAVIVEFRVFVGSPVEVLDFNLEFRLDLPIAFKMDWKASSCIPSEGKVRCLPWIVPRLANFRTG